MIRRWLVALGLVICCCSTSGGGTCCAEVSYCGGFVPGCFCAPRAACELSAP